MLSQFVLLGKVLTFRANSYELDELGWKSLLVGIPLVWLVGFGRWWDEPRSISWLHRSGLGSVAYVLVLSLLLWFVAAPLAVRTLPLQKMLAFVTFTAPPAFLYAIPVEMWLDRTAAVEVNIAFLSIVSIYRVSLLIWFLRRGAEMSVGRSWLCATLPIALIAFMLVYIGMTERMIDIMGGLRGATAADEAYVTVTFISCISIYAFPVLLILYGFALARR